MRLVQHDDRVLREKQVLRDLASQRRVHQGPLLRCPSSPRTSFTNPTWTKLWPLPMIPDSSDLASARKLRGCAWRNLPLARKKQRLRDLISCSGRVCAKPSMGPIHATSLHCDSHCDLSAIRALQRLAQILQRWSATDRSPATDKTAMHRLTNSAQANSAAT